MYIYLVDRLALEAGREALLELVSLLGVLDDQRVQVLRAAHLELERPAVLLLDCHATRVLAARRDQEVLDLEHLLRHLEYAVVCVETRYPGRRRFGIRRMGADGERGGLL